MNRQCNHDGHLGPAGAARARRFAPASGRLFRHRRRGASVVEFAVIAPIFFMLIFGMLEFGRMLMVQQVLTNAARSGARLAVIDGATASQVTSRIQQYLDGSSVSSQDVSIAITPSNPASADTGDPIQVTVSVPFDSVSWLPSPWFLDNQTLQASCTMRRE